MTSTTNHTIIITPTITLTTSPAIVPSTDPTPDTVAGLTSFLAKTNSQNIEPINGPRIKPNGMKNMPTMPPIKAPAAPHRVPPNHRVPIAPLMNSNIWDSVSNTPNTTNVHHSTPESSRSINQWATAAKNKIKCPGRKGTKVPTNPATSRHKVTIQAKPLPIIGRIRERRSSR